MSEVKADLVFLNGKIAKVDRAFGFCAAAAVKDGYIIDTGNDEEIREHIGEDTQVIDLEGKLMLPGAQDCHTHACLAGLYKQPGFILADREHAGTKEELKALIRQAAEGVPEGRWLIGAGLSLGALTRRDLDEADTGHPIWLANSGLHHILLNSRALALMGITGDTPQLKRHEGHIKRDESGEPNGWLDDFFLQDMVGRVSGQLSDEELESCIETVQAEMNRYGVTSHTDIAGIGGDYIFAGAAGSRAIDAYERMARQGRLTARVNVNVLAGLKGLSTFEAIVEGAKRRRIPEIADKNWVDAGAVKIFGDSMWLRKSGRKTGGSSYFPGDTDEAQREEITRTIVELHRLGFQIGIHSTGGAGIDAIVDAYARAEQLYPGKDLRHFVIHGDDFSDENMKKCAKYRIVLSSQAVAPWSFMEDLVESVDPEDPSGMFDYQRYMDNGVIVSQGSDAPCMTLNWLMGLKFAMTRRTVSGTDYNKGNGCSIEDGIRMYTINGAFQNHRERVTGSIEAGKLADLQVLDHDIFTLPPEEFDRVKVAMTVVNGKIVYRGE